MRRGGHEQAAVGGATGHDSGAAEDRARLGESDARDRDTVFGDAAAPDAWPRFHDDVVRQVTPPGRWREPRDSCDARFRRLGRVHCRLERIEEGRSVRFTARTSTLGTRYAFTQVFLDDPAGTTLLLLRQRLPRGRRAVVAAWLRVVARRAEPSPAVVVAGAVVFVVSLLCAWRGDHGKPLWPSVPWSALADPVVVSLVGGAAAAVVAHLIDTPGRRRVDGHGVRIVLTLATLAAAAACTSWGVAGLAHEPHAGQWLGLVVGLLLAVSSSVSFWSLRRGRTS
ncbi:hypothetical protein JOD57_000991 [Geodermatophilus bullaregiensis]|uniref:hypothetical protein n=1 Tax=Geodermatophilus bullaregiensis TaxID=1564160 RepID=UPI0019577C27|nr:hypothetical protein [Geodermatophilus bullaregiensis]MBM7805154.1 hypothetical protein [Geodermatophilus bullaregiensis]